MPSCEQVVISCDRQDREEEAEITSQGLDSDRNQSEDMRIKVGNGGRLHSIYYFPCFQIKPYVFFTNLVAFTIFMVLWQLRPYQQPIIIDNSPCSRPLTSTFIPVLSGEEEKLSVITDLKSHPTTTTAAATTTTITTTPPPPPPSSSSDKLNRPFQPHGNAAALYVHFGAHRGGPNSFGIIGLGSKPTHVYSKPWFRCEWVPNKHKSHKFAKGKIMLPDWGFGRVYTAVVVNCTFRRNPNADNSGGRLFLQAFYSESLETYEKIFLLEEAPGSYNESRFRPPFQYDYFYCGSPLFGTLNPKRVREWMAYQAYFFGPNSHFMLYDAGGVSPDVKKVLDPWIEIGRVTLQDVRGQAEYDGWYYNQFIILNDCLHQNRHKAKWTFMFDVDEYLYLPDGRTLDAVLRDFDGYTQFTIEQNPMSGKLCVNDSKRNHSSEWVFEKLNFKDDITGIWRDRKYAMQARNAYAAGVHMSEFLDGKTLHDTETRIRYYHYHGSISYKGELCRKLVPMPKKGSPTWFEKVPFVYDDNMTRTAPTIKEYERKMIGDRQAYLEYP